MGNILGELSSASTLFTDLCMLHNRQMQVTSLAQQQAMAMAAQSSTIGYPPACGPTVSDAYTPRMSDLVMELRKSVSDWLS